MTAGSGLKSAAFGSLNSGPNKRVYMADGDASPGWNTPPERNEYMCFGLPVEVISSDLKRVVELMWSAMTASMVGVVTALERGQVPVRTVMLPVKCVMAGGPSRSTFMPE